MKKADIAWAAGLFEGEGCISETHTDRPISRRGYQVHLGMCDEDAVNRLEYLFPSPNGLHIRKPPGKDTYLPQYIWSRSSKEGVAEFLEAILPFLCHRRAAKAYEALSWAYSPRPKRIDYETKRKHYTRKSTQEEK